MAHAVKLSALAAMWAWVAGCGGDATAPSEPSGAAPVETAVVETAVVASPQPVTPVDLDLSAEIADIASRFLPSLEPPAAALLAAALDELGGATARNDRGAATRALHRATSALRDDSASPADVDALRITLAALVAAIAPDPSSGRTP